MLLMLVMLIRQEFRWPPCGHCLWLGPIHIYGVAFILIAMKTGQTFLKLLVLRDTTYTEHTRVVVKL
jgi:hypothetical protein